jgi:hypothetical protein
LTLAVTEGGVIDGDLRVPAVIEQPFGYDGFRPSHVFPGSRMKNVGGRP